MEKFFVGIAILFLTVPSHSHPRLAYSPCYTTNILKDSNRCVTRSVAPKDLCSGGLASADKFLFSAVSRVFRRAQPPSLACTAKLLSETASTVKLRDFKVWYKVVSPVIESGAGDRLPVVVLHGGPGIPSDYLEPLNILAYKYGRKVYFYDQLGCGNSDEPQDPDFYSVDQCAEDVVSMVQHFADWCGLLEKGGFHLFGQSWGGCLTTEVMVSKLQGSDALRRGLVSTVLSASPITPERAICQARSLVQQYKNETLSMTPEQMGMRSDWPRTDEWVEQWRAQLANEKFQRLHNLRPGPGTGGDAATPACLTRALSKGGVVWRGAEAVEDWSMDAGRLRRGWPAGVRCLVMRGEHDFVDPSCVEEVMEGIPPGLVEYAELPGLSHMAHLEDPDRYVATLEGYLRRVEAGRQGGAAPVGSVR